MRYLVLVMICLACTAGMGCEAEKAQALAEVSQSSRKGSAESWMNSIKNLAVFISTLNPTSAFKLPASGKHFVSSRLAMSTRHSPLDAQDRLGRRALVMTTSPEDSEASPLQQQTLEVSADPRGAVWEIKALSYKPARSRKPEQYTVKVQRASKAFGSALCPPLLCIPPVGVGISRKFYEPLHRKWAAIGAPCELHTPELLGAGDAMPKPRRFYTPELWAEQLLDYINSEIKKPVVLVVQGGLLPVALEMWRQSGQAAIAGVSFISPPPLRFFSQSAEPEQGVRTRFRDSKEKPASRRQQRLFWLLSQSTIGNLFYRYLRAGKGQPRIRSFSERNLFAMADKVDDEWMKMCLEGSRDSRSRFSTLAYLCGTIPGGSWRDDRSDVLESIDVPVQVLQGDYNEAASQRLESFCKRLQKPSYCELIVGGRSVIPYENADQTAEMLLRFLAAEYDPGIGKLVQTVSTD